MVAVSWNDSLRGEEIAEAMYGHNADIVFQVAGGTGMGVFKAAVESGHYAVDVDSDQAFAIEKDNPEEARHILTSTMKNVGNGLYRALDLYAKGNLTFGKAEVLGIKEGGVGLARNKYYEMNTPDDVKARVDKAERDRLTGNISVKIVF